MDKQSKHGQYKCACGRILAGCKCPEHQNLIRNTYPSCGACQPMGRIKDQLGIKEK